MVIAGDYQISRLSSYPPPKKNFEDFLQFCTEGKFQLFNDCSDFKFVVQNVVQFPFEMKLKYNLLHKLLKVL